MIRSKIFNYCTSKRVFNHFFHKNNNAFNVIKSCRCLSMTKVNNNLNEKILTSDQHQKLEIFKEKEKYPEKEFLVRLKSDPDTFGNAQKEETMDEEDLKEEKFISEKPLPSQKLSTKQYADIIKKYIRQRRIKEAIDFVETKMYKEDRVKPEAYIFNLLLGACGRVGYTKKAFMLYNDMKRRGLKVMGGTYTALFNACSNSPWPTTDGLTRAQKLRDIMIEKGHSPNVTTYNAMIKAFGRGGDLSTAFLIVDEMISQNMLIKDDTINFLLQACITDKEAGFRHALLVWRKLIERKIQPSVHTYNLLLRSIRDCGLGNLEVTQDVINKLIPESNTLQLNSPTTELLESDDKHLPQSDNNFSENAYISDKLHNQEPAVAKIDNLEVVNNPKKISIDKYKPNLLADVPRLGNIISLSEVNSPEDRLFLVGGFKGFLDNMDQHKCSPNIKTITQLLDCIPSTNAVENDLLSFLSKYKLKPDIDFLNLLIKKKTTRGDYESGREVLQVMKKFHYRPDVVTYGVLAVGCQTKEQCEELIDEMKSSKYSLNMPILGAMLHQACSKNEFDYVLHIMDLCHTENINPDRWFMNTLQEFKKKCKWLYDKEFSIRQKKSFIEFKKTYSAWLAKVHVDESEDAHPWQQFRQTTEENKYYKPKDTARFKPIHRSLFKVKTSKKYVQVSK